MSTPAQPPPIPANDHTDRNDTLDQRQQIEEKESEGFDNPLWIVAFGMACLFGALAALLAFS
jgi:hypothetical protein